MLPMKFLPVIYIPSERDIYSAVLPANRDLRTGKEAELYIDISRPRLGLCTVAFFLKLVVLHLILCTYPSVNLDRGPAIRDTRIQG